MSSLKTILFVGLHRPGRSPSQRYRYEQFELYLKENGYATEYFYIISAQDDPKFYGAGKCLAKLWILIKGFVRLYLKSAKAGRYDLIFCATGGFYAGYDVF